MEFKSLVMKLELWTLDMKPSERIEELVSKRIREEGIPRVPADFYVGAIIQLLDEIFTLPNSDEREKWVKERDEEAKG